MAGSFTSLLLSEQLLIAFQSIGSINNVGVVVHLVEFAEAIGKVISNNRICEILAKMYWFS